jgi:hypothetical protein
MTTDLQQEVMDRLKCDITIDENGIERWYLNGELHRTDGPALIYPDGTQKWYRKGHLHRIGGPAVIWAGGGKDWWVDGVFRWSR